MTLLARNLGVTSGQRELRLCVALAGKGSGLKSRRGVAQVTPVAVGLGGEFSAVRLGMA